MKCTLIVDSEGPNPEFDPPKPSDFAGDMEAYADAKVMYAVPATMIVPAGTPLAGHECWMHCVPDGSGIAFDARGRPVRVAPAVIRAVPADDACQRAVDNYVDGRAASTGRSVDQVKAEIDAMVAAAKSRQAKIEAAKRSTMAGLSNQN